MLPAFLIIINLCLIPLLLMGVIRKAKALMQTRVGPPVLQPFFDIAKLMRKGETISETASAVFRWAPRVALALVAVIAVLTPWSGAWLPADWAPATNLLLVLYLLAMGRFAGMLAAMDTGSAFGGLGASREAMISLLIEPALVLSLGALAVGAKSLDLATIYAAPISPFIAAITGAALALVALAELSRMPVDDPTTHLELTMVHEAMVLENSGRNLAVIEYTVALRSCIFFGLAAQTVLHMWPGYHTAPFGLRYLISLLSLFAAGTAVAVAEGVLVKLKWRSVPTFLTLAIVISVIAALIAVSLR